MMNLESAWNHDAFFDYVDRWMEEDDTRFCAEINKHFPDPNLIDRSKDWFHQGYAGEHWVKEAWDMHRAGPGMPPTGRWKPPKDQRSLSPKPAADAQQN